MKRGISTLIAAFLPLLAVQTASAATFSDVPNDSPINAAVEYLVQQQIVSGYEDGTFRPNAPVNRSEAVKMIVASRVSQSDLNATGDSPFADVPRDAWFRPYVEVARTKLGIIDGPPAKTTFNGGEMVLLNQFLKMYLLAKGIAVDQMYTEVRLPLASDVRESDSWFYPYMRYAVSSSMILAHEDGTLKPGTALTRGDIALLIYRHAMYEEGRRTQALLTEAEQEIVNILEELENERIDYAAEASARSLLAARGALTSRPDSDVVKGAVKVSEGFLKLVESYILGAQGQYDAAIARSGDAWHLAESARQFSSNLDTIATQMQDIAKNMADEARTLKNQ